MICFDILVQNEHSQIPLQTVGFHTLKLPYKRLNNSAFAFSVEKPSFLHIVGRYFLDVFILVYVDQFLWVFRPVWSPEGCGLGKVWTPADSPVSYCRPRPRPPSPVQSSPSPCSPVLCFCFPCCFFRFCFVDLHVFCPCFVYCLFSCSCLCFFVLSGSCSPLSCVCLPLPCVGLCCVCSSLSWVGLSCCCCSCVCLLSCRCVAASVSCVLCLSCVWCSCPCVVVLESCFPKTPSAFNPPQQKVTKNCTSQM